MFWSPEKTNVAEDAGTDDSRSYPSRDEPKHYRRSRDVRHAEREGREVQSLGVDRNGSRSHRRSNSRNHSSSHNRSHSRSRSRSHSRGSSHSHSQNQSHSHSRSRSHSRGSSHSHSQNQSHSHSYNHSQSDSRSSVSRGGVSRSRSRSTEDRRRHRKALVTALREHEQHMIDSSFSELSSMKVIENSSDGRGYDGGDVGGSIRTVRPERGSDSMTDDRPGGKEPAVQGCSCMSAVTFAKTLAVFAAMYYAAMLWTVHYDDSTGKLCSFYNKSMCAETVASKVLLTISRFSAGILTPSICFCILSKCYATRYFLNHSWLSLVVNVEPAHNLHTYFGVAILVSGCIHGVTHMARIVYDGSSMTMLSENVNRSGLVAMMLLIPIAMPMMFSFLKSWFPFEIRKVVHMLFIPFVIALCFHTPTLCAVGAILLAWYIMDRLYFTTRMTFFIERPVYKPVGRGTFVRFDLPPGYQFKVGAYVQVNCPAISAYEWHPFSLFPVPGAKSRAGFHVEAVGDWTRELFRLCLENPHMPLWISAAQPSILEKSIYFDNVVLVCTGAGITPAVSVAEMFAKKKNVHLIWLSREASMVAMFEKQLRQVKSTVHLTSNPSPKTRTRILELLAPSRSEVVITAPRASTRPSSRSSSLSDMTALEAGAGYAPSAGELMGELHEDGNISFVDGVDGRDSLLGGSALGAYGRERSSRRGSSSRSGGSSEGERSRGSRAAQKRSRGLHPVSVNFGRPDVEQFISETVQGTALRPEWVDHCRRASVPEKNDRPHPRTKQYFARQALERLTTSQRITKRDLMSADLSVVAKTAKASFVLDSEVSVDIREGSPLGDIPSTDPSTWLVLYCGANLMVEKAVASACEKLKVSWRKEYFSAW